MYEIIGPLSPAQFRERYVDAILSPTATRRQLAPELQASGSLHLVYCPERQMHVIGNPDLPVVATANGGCFEFNSHAIYETSVGMESDHVDIIDGDVSDGPLTYAFTRPGDTLVIANDSEGHKEEQLLTLRRMAESFRAIGIELTDDIQQVPKLSAWLTMEDFPQNVLMHVLSPRALPSIAKNEAERKALQLQALLHTALYSKRGFQEFCSESGIPTPKTIYHTYHSEAIDSTIQELEAAFSKYDTYVISRDCGVGGTGVKKGVTANSLRQGALSGFADPGEILMTQGQLPLLQNYSPCTRYFLGDDGIQFLGVTVQRFLDEEGKVYGGNKWHKDLLKELEALAPGFAEVNGHTAKKLQELGVRGVVNLDSLIVDASMADSLNENGQILMREANVRPAMSQWANRLEKGSVNGKVIERIHTKTQVVIADDFFQDDNFVESLNSLDPNIRVVIGARYPDSNKTYLAFVANADVTEEALNDFEIRVLSLITSS